MGVDPDYEIDVRVPDRELTIDEARELNVRLNKNMGQWDFDVLANNFEIEDLKEWGFSDYELDLNLNNKPEPWVAEEQEEFFAGEDGIEVKAGYRLGSVWYGMTANNEVRKYMLELPSRSDSHNGATVKLKYSRTKAGTTERIVKTYMRTGDRFFEMCCGWMTFSGTAKYFGYSGKGGDIWDVSLDFCKRQLKAMPGEGNVEVVYADCRNTGEPDNTYDFVHSNPPFFNLEPYDQTDKDLASLGSYELWLNAMGEMGAEAERILKPGGLANFVINDYRKEGAVIPMHADFTNAIIERSTLKLHDLVIAEVISQALRFRKHDYERRRTVKCHEYIITFIKPDSR
jgi:SAM-dependent methyltransferase